MFKRLGSFIGNTVKRFFGIFKREDSQLPKNNLLSNSYFLDMDEDYRQKTAPGLNADVIPVFEEEKDH